MKRLHIPIMTLLFTLLIGSAIPGMADDTDLYINMTGSAETSEKIRPNLLFLFDASGSMNDPIMDAEIRSDGTGREAKPSQNRQQVLQNALLTTLGRIQDVNVGLGRFTQAQRVDPAEETNAAILYPIAFIDAPIAEIEGEGGPLIIPVSAPIADDADDAEENLFTKKMSLYDPELELTEIPESDEVGITTESPTILDSAGKGRDDAKEYLGDGYGGVYSTKPDHAIGRVWSDGAVIPLGGYTGNQADAPVDTKKLNLWNGETLVGLRFKGEDGKGIGIPQGAIITKAVVAFTAHNPDDYMQGDLSLAIQASYDGETKDALFSQDYSVSDSRTTRSVKDTDGKPITVYWDDVPLFDTEGKVYTFTDENLTKLIQTIVDQGCEIEGKDKTCDSTQGWQYGNNISLFFERKRVDDNGSPLPKSKLTTGMRAFKTAEADDSPKLRISWYSPPTPIQEISKSSSGGNVQKKEYGVDGSDTRYIRLGNDPFQTRGPTKVGVRFEGVSIPSGAKIKEAKIVFTHQSATSQKDGDAGRADTDLMIYAEKVSDSTKLSGTIGGVAVPTVTERISTYKTDKSVAWENIAEPPDAFKYSVAPSTSDIDKYIENFETPDLKEVLQEIVAQPEWAHGNAVTFLFESKDGSKGSRRIVAQNDTTSGTDLTRNFTTVKQTDTTLPRLEVVFSVADPADPDVVGVDPKAKKQIVGLRFQTLTVPYGAEIVSAKLTVKSKKTTKGTANLKIQVEEVDYDMENGVDAKPFTPEEGSISARKLSSPVSWSITDPWEEGIEYSSPDLTQLVQTVINKPGWCGGSTSIVFVISAQNEKESPFRSISSYADAFDKAPVLNVEYNADTVQGGCLNQRKTWRISDKDDDAEEFKIGMEEPGLVDVKSQTLELADTKPSGGTIERIVGLRFPDIPISPGSKIRDARLEFRSSKDLSGAVTLKIQGQKGNAAPFVAEKNNLSKRPRTSTKVSWSPEAWKSGIVYKTSDISGIIQEIIDGAWEANDDLAFFIEHESGAGYRATVGLGNDASQISKVASLTIQIEGELEGGGLETVRFRLMNVVKKMDLGLWTNIVDGLYEAAQYYRGGKVTFGKDRYRGGKYDAQGRITHASHVISHPITYKNGTLVKDERCTELFPYDPICATERIEGSPDYVSPIKEAGNLGGGVGNCPIAGQASSYIILLTDGIATRNRAADKVQQLIGGSCKPTPSNYECRKGGCGTCGLELVEYLATHNNGFNRGREIDGSNVCVHTIGFNLGKGWEPVRDGSKNFVRDENGDIIYKENAELTKANDEARKYLQDLADSSCPDSRYFDATTEEELSAAFESIVSSAIVSSASFAAPTVSVSMVNKLQHRNEVYYAVFRPGSTPRWHGNVKKYRICTNAMKKEGKCKYVGLIIDSEGKSVIDPETNYVKSDAKSFWSQDVDGNNVTRGGAGSKIPSESNRKIFTYLPDADEAQPIPGTNHKIVLKEHELSIVLEEKRALLEKAFGDLSNIDGIDGVKDVVDWILGMDVLNEKSDGNGRWRFADPLHSSPVAIPYLKDGSEVVKLVVGTNDGLLHLIHAEDTGAGAGREEWAFLPEEMLPIQPKIMSNVSMGGRIYGIDGTPSTWMKVGSDGILNQNDEFVRVFVGMRRGGSNYYALDITNTESPKLMWTIRGAVKGSNVSAEDEVNVADTQQSSVGFEKLGQSWSSPLPTKIIWNGQTRNVLVFAGGFDPNLEGTSFNYKESKIGNAIYIVDLAENTSGALLWWASDSRENEEGGDAKFLALADMKYAIPSTIKLADSNGDRHSDRLYVGDLGGQVWRIDLDNLGDQGQYDAGVGGVLARVGGSGQSEYRRFFYPPEVYLDKADSWVTITSGSRPIPLDTVIQDRFFALKDRASASQLRALFTGDNIKECEDRAGASHPTFCTITSSNMPLINLPEDNVDGQMYDATLHLETDIAETGSAATGNEDSETTVVIDEDKLANSLGWYINLRADYNYETGQLVRAKGDFKGEKGLASPLILEMDDGVKVFFSTYTPWTDGVPLDKCEGMSRLYALDLTSGEGITKALKDGITSDIILYSIDGGIHAQSQDTTLSLMGINNAKINENGDLVDENGNIIEPLEDDCSYGALVCNRLQRSFWQQIFEE